jgi:hypothetical protein
MSLDFDQRWCPMGKMYLLLQCKTTKWAKLLVFMEEFFFWRFWSNKLGVDVQIGSLSWFITTAARLPNFYVCVEAWENDVKVTLYQGPHYSKLFLQTITKNTLLKETESGISENKFCPCGVCCNAPDVHSRTCSHFTRAPVRPKGIALSTDPEHSLRKKNVDKWVREQHSICGLRFAWQQKLLPF